LIGPSQKKVEIVDVPQNTRIYGKMECLPFWLTYIGVKGRTLGKTCGIKVMCYWEHPWGEFEGNMFKWVSITGRNIRNALVGKYHNKVEVECKDCKVSRRGTWCYY
jgi:hypothetical protein